MANNLARREGSTNYRSRLKLVASNVLLLLGTALLAAFAGSVTYLVTITLLLSSDLPLPILEAVGHLTLAELTFYLYAVVFFPVIAVISALALGIVKLLSIALRRGEGSSGSSDPKLVVGGIVFGGLLGVLIGLWLMMLWP